MTTKFTYCLQRCFHVARVIERIEYAENIHTIRYTTFYEAFYYIISIVAIA